MSTGSGTGNKWPRELLVDIKKAQAAQGYVSTQAITELAESASLPENDVFGVASFYSFLSTKPLGRNVIRMCKSLPCHIKGGQDIIYAIGHELGIKPGETTADQRFSFLLTECIGLCDKPPAMLINDEPHTGLTPENIPEILKSYK
ncbi:NADH-quinone oxidoreductase subunit NuoE [Chloroflexota bacterium]